MRKNGPNEFELANDFFQNINAIFIFLRCIFCLLHIWQIRFSLNSKIEEYVILGNNIISLLIFVKTDTKLKNTVFKLEHSLVRGARTGAHFFWILLAIFLLLFLFSFSLEILENRFDLKFFIFCVCRCYQKLTCVTVTVGFLVFTTEIKNQLKILKARIQKIENGSVAIEQIEADRAQYEHIILVIEDVNQCVGRRLLIPLTTMPLEMVLWFLSYVFHRRPQNLMGVAAMFLSYCISIYAIVSTGSDITQTVNIFWNFILVGFEKPIPPKLIKRNSFLACRQPHFMKI